MDANSNSLTDLPIAISVRFLLVLDFQLSGNICPRPIENIGIYFRRDENREPIETESKDHVPHREHPLRQSCRLT
jgi:hypothetical protein